MEYTKDRKKKKHYLTWFILILLIAGLKSHIKEIPNNSDDWIAVGVFILIIGNLLLRIFYTRKNIIKKATAFLVILSIHLALGSGLIHNTGERYQSYDSPKIFVGNKIDYTLCLDNDLNFPIGVDMIIPLNEEGIEYLYTNSKILDNKDITLKINFNISSENILYPKNVIIIYRVFGCIPMVNIVKLHWRNSFYK